MRNKDLFHYKKKQGTLIVLSFISIYIVWGSTYLLNKIAVTELAPFFLASIRFIIAGILIFIIAGLLGHSLTITRKQLINTAFLGFVFLSYGNGVAVWALKYMDSSFAALEISAQPLVILLMMYVLQGKKIQPMSIFGVVLGVVGIYLLVSQKEILAQENSVLGILMIFSVMLFWGYGSLYVKKADLPSNYFVNTGYQMFIAGVFLAIMSLMFAEEWSWPQTWQTDTQWAMVLLIVFGSIVAFTSFNFLLKHVSPEKVATNTYVNPIVALFLGWLFLDEKITLQSIIAAIILLAGVYFINSKKKLMLFERFRK
ncbi:drug/metabolite exporter YedA [Croceitalea sp. MTPC9]|uniref:EamA family transporter n=1 Tax=unclassified Croceitalea TaxID=2632280 RepID=UPI002B368119|nr:drug/metabolite exporter YedA [Croceitalea sp. MTPC6]GMN15717.1 drug/metabolite exporter YedA [Croceitalea sp. MTPC9]